MRRKRNRFFAATSLVALMAMCTLPLPSDGCKPCAAKKMEKALQQKHSALEPLISLEAILHNIHDLTSLQTNCASPYHAVAVPFSTKRYEAVQDKIDLVAKILGDYNPQNDTEIFKTVLEETCRSEDTIYLGRILWIGNGTLLSPKYYAEARRSPQEGDKNHEFTEFYEYQANNKPWLREKEIAQRSSMSKWSRGPYPGEYSYGQWTEPYFSCDVRKWLITYTAFMYAETKIRKHHKRQNAVGETMVGLISADIDVMDMDINQCDTIWNPSNGSTEVAHPQVEAFLGTHKCHNETSECIFTPGHGWVKGAYNCRCRHGFYSATGYPIFNGSLVELAWKEKKHIRSPSYDMLYVCKRCAPGCSTCVNDSPCLSHYNWAFRISLLTISVMCILLTLVLACYIYRYRKLKVIKVASPIFLCITLGGCAIMYLEMAAIFPVLDVFSCVATKWTRNMGFCITYSALLLKTWRVSLTYRVKSAHKLKLTDKQLLQWLFPILLVMAIYLGTWTISAPPQAIYIVDWYGLKFKQCDYSWWDHSLAIGEFLFLLWGIRVCYSVRNAESFFNEAKHISWAIYNITIVNIIMVLIHLVILPSAGPDIKYLFGFIRTQLSTTVTIILIFGPKFYRVIKGQGDSWDNRARARGVTASFSLNGVGLVHEETTDLYQENEELKPGN